MWEPQVFNVIAVNWQRSFADLQRHTPVFGLCSLQNLNLRMRKSLAMVEILNLAPSLLNRVEVEGIADFES